MIRAHRVAATAQDEASMVSGWNVAPNVDYSVTLLPGAISCGVLVYADGALVASGAALTGTDQPCVLLPQGGYALGMIDAELGWHLLLTTVGTESQRTIRINPAVDLPDEIHPVYADDDLALVRATAGIDGAAHYIDDATVMCPLGLGAWIGDIVSVPVVGQVETITWTATSEGASETAVVRRHVAIAPSPHVDPVPPVLVNDTGVATHLTGTSGNVLVNDAAGLSVVAINGFAANVGVAVDGDNGGSFVINADGLWAFDPDGDFALLESSETADTSVTYHASDGVAEAIAILTITVSRANAAPVAVDDAGETTADATTSGNVLTNDADYDDDTLHVSRVAGGAANVGVAVAGSSGGLFTIASNGAWTFDPDSDFGYLLGETTATTSVTYHVSDGTSEDEGLLTVTVSAAAAIPIDFIAHYKLDSVSSGLEDETGNYTLSITGSLTKSEGIINDAVVFPGTTGNFASRSVGFGSAELYLCGWVYPGNISTQRPICAQWNANPNLSWLLDIFGGNFRWIAYNGSTTPIVSVPATVSAWQFVEAWVVGGKQGLCTDRGSDVQQSFSGSLRNTGVPIYFGRKGDSATVLFSGILDSFRFYTYLPTTAQRDALYAEGGF
ncbi:MAG: Ig-like domain-containing protein [Desulfomicrobium sp.]